MNNRQRSKQVSYTEKYSAKVPTDLKNEMYENDDNIEEIDRGYIAPAKPPAHKHGDVKGDAQSRRLRPEPKFHKDKSEKAVLDQKDEGKMKKYKNLDDIPDYDDGIANRNQPKVRQNNSAASKWQANDEESAEDDDYSSHNKIIAKSKAYSTYDDDERVDNYEQKRNSNARQPTNAPPKYAASYDYREDEEDEEPNYPVKSVNVRKLATPNMEQKFQQQRSMEAKDSMEGNGIRWQQVKSNNKQSTPPQVIQNIQKSNMSHHHAPLDNYDYDDEPVHSARMGKPHSSPTKYSPPPANPDYSNPNSPRNRQNGKFPNGFQNQVPISPREKPGRHSANRNAVQTKGKYEEDEWSEDETEADMRYSKQYNSYEADGDDEYYAKKAAVAPKINRSVSEKQPGGNAYVASGNANYGVSQQSVKQTSAQRFISPMQLKPTGNSSNNVPSAGVKKDSNMMKAGQNVLQKQTSQNAAMESVEKFTKIRPDEINSPEKRRQQGQQQGQQLFNNPEEQLFYSKQARPVEYKPYTLNQYRNIKPKEYVEIANLKPDLNSDELKAKRANQDRIKEFSKNLLNVNKSILSEQRKLPASNEISSIQISKQADASNRARALEFAKNVPKPKVVREVSEPALKAKGSKAAAMGYDDMMEEEDDHFVMENDIYGANYMTNAKLEQLENKHQDTRKQVDAIKKSLGLK